MSIEGFLVNVSTVTFLILELNNYFLFISLIDIYPNHLILDISLSLVQSNGNPSNKVKSLLAEGVASCQHVTMAIH